MALQQSIEHARPAGFADALARTGEALAWLRARHADGTLPLLRLPEKRDDIAAILGYAALLRDGATDIVFLGTGGSSLGGQTLAQLAGYARAGRRRCCAIRRACISWTISTPTASARCCSGCRSRPARFVAISKSGGTGETLMQTIAALAALKAARPRSARPLPRPHRAGQARQGQRPARPAGGPQHPHARPRSRRRRPLSRC